ncbi:copper oxidase [Burkholderia sp. WAC0059]|uniref:multicopper oxidase family protein n=1 Tax=Burkholderia sp. WAC0059 TaxID=2066022 RepID=UPI000C7F31A8|nr:multicopper oxidase family protein [Burkholderia sp. WAC0059]PLZ01199.1 copper oxidase [Burkholderia sp. WAC0059]
MIRREFLLRMLGASAASLFAGRALADAMAPMMHGGGMSAAMPGMAMAPTSGSAAPGMLAAADALPSGAPLAALRRLANESRERGVFRATLIAQPSPRPLLPGQPATPFWLYDGGSEADAAQASGPVVGPLIDVHEGDTLEIRFVNRLAQPTTIHWHGLPVPADQDGNPSNPVAPGATHIYRFTLPGGSAGTYWYHPHPDRLSSEQVSRGLAGPIIVRAKNDPLAGWPERHLFVSDLRLAADGNIPANGMMDWMNGREGQFVLVNGALRPQWTVAGGERWRVWNACSARYLNLTLGAQHPFAQVGTDGGLLEAPRAGLTSLLLAPGERAELVVSPPADAGETTSVLMAAQYDRGKMAMSGGELPPDPDRALADLRFAASAADTQAERALPARLRTIAPLGEAGAQKSVVFSEEMDMRAMMQAPGASASGMPRGMRFLVNGTTFEMGRATLTSRRGEVERWSIGNHSDMDHPFHLHGTQFQVLGREIGGKTRAEPFLAWRDTVNLRPGETVRIATVQRLPGDRMFHCHILEHEDLGMMGTLRVL